MIEGDCLAVLLNPCLGLSNPGGNWALGLHLGSVVIAVSVCALMVWNVCLLKSKREFRLKLLGQAKRMSLIGGLASLTATLHVVKDLCNWGVLQRNAEFFYENLMPNGLQFAFNLFLFAVALFAEKHAKSIPESTVDDAAICHTRSASVSDK